MEKLLQDDERLDYLLAEELRIIQSPSVFSFSLGCRSTCKICLCPDSFGEDC